MNESALIAADSYFTNKNLELDIYPIPGGTYIAEADPVSIVGSSMGAWLGGWLFLVTGSPGPSVLGSPGLQRMGAG